jgi:hypothetical protein
MNSDDRRRRHRIAAVAVAAFVTLVGVLAWVRYDRRDPGSHAAAEDVGGEGESMRQSSRAESASKQSPPRFVREPERNSSSPGSRSLVRMTPLERQPDESASTFAHRKSIADAYGAFVTKARLSPDQQQAMSSAYFTVHKQFTRSRRRDLASNAGLPITALPEEQDLAVDLHRTLMTKLDVILTPEQKRLLHREKEFQMLRIPPAFMFAVFSVGDGATGGAPDEGRN